MPLPRTERSSSTSTTLGNIYFYNIINSCLGQIAPTVLVLFSAKFYVSDGQNRMKQLIKCNFFTTYEVPCVREVGILYSCGLGCWGGRHAIPWERPGVQSPVAVWYGAVWLGGAY